jgi:hypothetical protein
MFGVVGISGVMRAKADLISILTLSIVGLALGSVGIDCARAQDAPAADNCLAAPTGKAPQGSHWRYRTDPNSHSKCWHLQPDDAAQNAGAQNAGAQSPGAQDGATAAAAAPATAAESTGQDAAHPPRHTAHKRNGGQNGTQTATPAAGQPAPQAASPPVPTGVQSGGAQAGMPAGAQPPQQAAGGSSPWPDPPSPAASGGNPAGNSPANSPWPDPSRAQADTQQATGAAQPVAGPTSNVDAQQPMPATAAGADQAGGSDAAADTPTATAAATPVSANGDAPVGLLLALAIAMLVAGLLLRRIVKTIFARRSDAGAARREPVLRTNRAGERTITLPVPDPHDPAPDWVDRLDQDVREALRHLLRTLERQAA